MGRLSFLPWRPHSLDGMTDALEPNSLGFKLMPIGDFVG